MLCASATGGSFTTVTVIDTVAFDENIPFESITLNTNESLPL